MIILSPFELDALIEIANIGMSRAATQLSLLLNDEILVSIPTARVVEPDDFFSALSLAQQEDAVCAGQHLSGGLEGYSLLLLPLKQSRTLISALIDHEPLLEGTDMRIFEHEAMTEIANIIISSAITVMADLLKVEIRLSVPTYGRKSLDALFKHTSANGTKHDIIILDARLNATHKLVSGSLVLALTVNSMSAMLARLHDFASGNVKV